MQGRADKETKPSGEEMAPLITNQAARLTATLREIFQMFADVVIFLAVFYVAKGRACAVESCKNSALPSSGEAKSHEARELSDC